ncbi:mandelate racemase/muconate lactonizing enzyme family protein [Mycolicibacterium mageritense]|uniref:mandelate racemase/muconate lactonizing enzyme family protein n=1 Tax=Mycolicibacterium mageritense TaxID=53462 RepID=UPI0030B9003F
MTSNQASTNEENAMCEYTISNVATSLLSIPLPRPLITAAFPIPAIDTALVRVRTKGGADGFGWSFAFGRGRVAALVRLIDDLGQLVIGRDVRDAQALITTMAEATGFIGQRGLAALAMSAVDVSCWDIRGKVAGLPVFKLIGAYRDAVEVYASQGLWLDRDIDELVAEARALVDRGFTAVKMRAGLPNHDADVARVAAVRTAIGPDVKLMVDANQAWDLKTTISMAERLAPYNLFWLEEPMPHRNVDDYVVARERMPMPMCTGESNFLFDEISALAQRRAADYVMPDLMRMGGATNWLKAAHACEAVGVRVTPHLFMEHSAHLAASCPNALWQEFQPWWEPILSKRVEIAHGKIQLGAAPGFGVELDEKAIQTYRV